MSIAPVAASVSQAKRGSESCKAHTLSQQFQNLCRGESFAKLQMAKWKHPETGLKKDDLMIVESLAYRAMKYFGYEAAHVKEPCDGKCYITCPRHSDAVYPNCFLPYYVGLTFFSLNALH